MDVFFDKSTLAKSSINGTGRITNTLDKHVISALFGTCLFSQYFLHNIMLMEFLFSNSLC